MKSLVFVFAMILNLAPVLADDVSLKVPYARCESGRDRNKESHFVDFSEFRVVKDSAGVPFLEFTATASWTRCTRFSDRYAWKTLGLYANDYLRVTFYKGSFSGSKRKFKFHSLPPVQRPDYVERLGMTDVRIPLDEILNETEMQDFAAGKSFEKKGATALCSVSVCRPSYHITLTFPRPIY